MSTEVALLHPTSASPYLDNYTPTQGRCDMNDHSGSFQFQTLFESALRDYEKQTGITLANHPLAEQLQDCQSVESVTTLLHGQARAFNKFKGNDRVVKSLKSVVSVIAALGQVISMVCLWLSIGYSTSLTSIQKSFPPADTIYTGLGILLSVCDIRFYMLLRRFLVTSKYPRRLRASVPTSMLSRTCLSP